MKLRSFISGNICFEFLVQCLCRVAKRPDTSTIANSLSTTMCLSIHVQVVPSWNEMVWITNFAGETNMVAVGWHFCFWVSLQDHAKPSELLVFHGTGTFSTTIVCGWVTFLYHGVPSNHAKPSKLSVFLLYTEALVKQFNPRNKCWTNTYCITEHP